MPYNSASNKKAGPAPANARILTESDARSLITSAEDAHREYHQLIRIQQEHLDGKPPFDPSKLKSQNLAWMHNRSYGKATAKSEKLVADKTFSVIGGFSFGYPIFEIYDEKKHAKDAPWLRDDVTKDFYADAIRLAYAATLEKESRVYDMISRVSYYSTNWGVGFVTRDNDDWLGYGQKLTDVFFPRATEFDNIDCFITFGEQEIRWFFDKYEKLGKNSPWNKEALEDLFIWSMGPDWNNQNKGRTRSEKWKLILSSWEENSFTFSRNDYQIRFSKIWTEEFKGGVTETYVFYTGVDGESISSEILFQTHYKKRCIFDFIEKFRDNPITSTGVVQNMRGIARFSVPDSHHFNVKRNAIEDKLMIAGNIQFEQTARNQGEKFDLQVTSVATILPVGYKVAEQQKDPRLQDHIQALTLDEVNYQRETGHYDPSLTGRLGDRATTKEVERQSLEVSRQQNAKDVVLREDWGRYHANCLRRLANDSYSEGDTGYKGQKCFIHELARAAKVSEEEAKEIAKRVEDFDMAPILGDQMGMKESIQLTPDPYKKNELTRQLLYMMGHSRARIEFLRPRQSRFEIVSGEAQLADLQNAMLWNQTIPLFNPDNDPKTALDVHFKRFDEAIQMASRGADPVKTLNYLRAGLEFTKNHLARMVEDPFYGEEAAKPYLSKYQGYGRILVQLEQIAQRQALEMQKQAQQGQVDPETQQRMQMEAIEFQTKQARLQANQEAEGQRREEKHQQAMRIKDENQQMNMFSKWESMLTPGS